MNIIMVCLVNPAKQSKHVIFDEDINNTEYTTPNAKKMRIDLGFPLNMYIE